MTQFPPGVRVVEGGLSASGLRFALVCSRFNATITEPLLDGAVSALLRAGAAAQDVMVVRCPGAWELPQTAAAILREDPPDALIALGCLMRGETIHFDLIAAEATGGLASLGHKGEIPVVYGLLTTDTFEQAVHRAGAKHGNKGAEAAMAAVEQANAYRELRRLAASRS